MTEKPEKLNFEIFIAMNEGGDVAFGTSANEAKELLVDNYESLAVRIVAIGVAMTPPAIETGPHVDIPDNAGETVEVEPVEESAAVPPGVIPINIAAGGGHPDQPYPDTDKITIVNAIAVEATSGEGLPGLPPAPDDPPGEPGIPTRTSSE